MLPKLASICGLLAAMTGLQPVTALADFRIGKLPPTNFGAEVAVGMEYDSNVSVEEVDRASDESDYAYTFNIGVDVDQKLSEKADFGLNYDYSQSKYLEFSQVDRQTHILGSDFTWRLDAVDTDVSVFYIHSRLDGESFLDLARISPAVSGFLAKRWFVRTAYVYQDKSLKDRAERDATSHALEADVYFFLTGLRRYFNLGYRFKDENAEAKPLDYRSNGVKLRYVQRIKLFSRLAKLELSWRYEARDYLYDTESIGKKREDRRHRVALDLEVPVTDKGALQFYYGYADYNSNLERVDYTQDIAGARFIYRW